MEENGRGIQLGVSSRAKKMIVLRTIVSGV